MSHNTFKHGDLITVIGFEAQQKVAYISGPYVYFDGGAHTVHHEACTLVPQPKFKPGDVVSIPSIADDEYIIKELETDTYAGNEHAYNFASGGWEYERNLVLVRRSNEATLGDILDRALKPRSPSIVARFEHGKYLPSMNPRIHDTKADADVEARRLAVANPGVQFCTFVLTSTSVAPSPVAVTVAA